MPDSDIAGLKNSFTAIGPVSDLYNKIYVEFKAEDLERIKISLNGVKINMSDKVIALGDGTYAVYTGVIGVTEFDKAFTFKMYVDNALYQTVTCSVNSCLYDTCADLTASDEAALTPEARLALALYRYSVSAKAYSK